MEFCDRCGKWKWEEGMKGKWEWGRDMEVGIGVEVVKVREIGIGSSKYQVGVRCSSGKCELRQ